MAQFVTLNPDKLTALREIDERLVSYNIEMTEVTGGTFWKAYTEAQVDGTEEFPVIKDWTNMGNLQQWYDPIDTTNQRLIKLAKELGTAWVRVSGTWANKTYYDFDGKCNGKAPEGFQNVLTKKQWLSLLDFVKAIDGKLLVSIANCPGIHAADEPMPFDQAELLFKTSKEYGVPISAAEFTNEPNMLEDTGFPKGYKAEHYHRDADLFAKWLKENYPECLYVGTSDTGGADVSFGKMNKDNGTGGVEQLARDSATCDELFEGLTVPVDVFSYHYYNGLSDRLASVMPAGHWDASEANGEDFLDVAPKFCRTYIPYRDKYAPGTEMWVTESGEAGGGGSTWSSTYLDVLRTLNELGGFSALTKGVIFHNTLPASDYAFLARFVHDPRPNFFAVKLWLELMGTDVYAANEPIREGAHVYVQSYKPDASKKCYLIINNSETETTTVEAANDGLIWVLAGKDGFKRATVMTLNGNDLVLGENWELPDLSGAPVAAGKIELAPMTCTFLVQ